MAVTSPMFPGVEFFIYHHGIFPPPIAAVWHGEFVTLHAAFVKNLCHCSFEGSVVLLHYMGKKKIDIEIPVIIT